MTRRFNDQQVLGFLVSQRSYIETEVNRTVYPEIQYPSLVPIDTSAPDWISTVTYYSQDMYGKADWINPNADDVPKAGTNRAKYETAVHTAGIGYGYGVGELETAIMMGTNLAAEDAMAARRAYEEMVDRVVTMGDVAKGFYGLINAPGVTAGSAVNGNWLTTATPLQMIADVNTALTGQYSGTLFTSVADTLLLPYAHWLKLATTPMSADNSQSVLDYITTKNVFTAATGRPLTVRAVRGLETAGAGGTARMVSYRYDRNVLKLHIPMPHKFLETWRAGPLRWEVPGIFRLGGLDVRRPKEMAYTDGI